MASLRAIGGGLFLWMTNNRMTNEERRTIERWTMNGRYDWSCRDQTILEKRKKSADPSGVIQNHGSKVWPLQGQKFILILYSIVVWLLWSQGKMHNIFTCKGAFRSSKDLLGIKLHLKEKNKIARTPVGSYKIMRAKCDPSRVRNSS